MKIVKELKCHVKQEEVNPYPRYVYGDKGSGLKTAWYGWGKLSKKQLEEVANERHTNSDWLLWQLRHGKDISSDDLK